MLKAGARESPLMQSLRPQTDIPLHEKSGPRRSATRFLTVKTAAAYAFLAMSTIVLKPAGSWMAISASILRLSVTPALMSPAMNFE